MRAGAFCLPFLSLDFGARPILVFWETTRACALRCRHCRASAMPHPLPGQLDTAEGLALIDQVAAFGRPHPVLILTGGDCLARPDLYELAAHARSRGVHVALSPSVTPSLDAGAHARMAEVGVRALSISLDGARAETHEAVRGIPGHFQATLDAIRAAVAAGFRVQVNTTAMAGNAEELPEVAALVSELGVAIWEVFFLVVTGRAGDALELTPEQCEAVCHLLYDAGGYGFVVRTVEGPFFRRVAACRRDAGELGPVAVAERFGLDLLYLRSAQRLRALLGPPVQPRGAQTLATRDGSGILFVAHDGDIYPAGFLPIPLGNVRERPLVDVYRDHPLLRALRAADFGGRCGACDFRDLCGGSRSRAFAATGDPLGEDPACAYGRIGRALGPSSVGTTR